MGVLALGIDDCLLREAMVELEAACSVASRLGAAVMGPEAMEGGGGFLEGMLSGMAGHGVSGDGSAVGILCTKVVPPLSTSSGLTGLGSLD